MSKIDLAPRRAQYARDDGWHILANVLERNIGLSTHQLSALLARCAARMADESTVAYADLLPATDVQKGSAPGTRVAIVGGGVAGFTAAHELIARGYEVDLYEASDTFGGKSRSVEVPDSARDGRAALPGEHGFRFFPAFYRHVRDTMARIACADRGDETVLSRLVPTRHVTYVRPNEPEHVESTDRLAADDVAFFLRDRAYTWASARVLTACNQRRLTQLEHVSMDALCQGSDLSELPQLLVACSAQAISARTAFTILSQLSTGRATSVVDAMLDGPTSERWFEPWRAQLARDGVRFHLGHRLDAITLTDGSVRELVLYGPKGEQRTVTADHVILAVPVEVATAIVARSPALVEAAPSLATLARLETDWMAGLQLFYDEPLGFRTGHYVFAGSPWAITALDQSACWPDFDHERVGDGNVRAIVSAIISDWHTPGILFGKPASQCSEEELIEETVQQMIRALPEGSRARHLLGREHLLRAYLGPGITTPSTTPDHAVVEAHNETPLFVNTVGSYPNRPCAATEVPNLYLAADYVRTNTDLACMESANEAARRAVNGLLERSGSEHPRCTVFPLYEPPALGLVKALDGLLLEAGAPGVLDVLSTSARDEVLAALADLPASLRAFDEARDDKARHAEYVATHALAHLASRLSLHAVSELFEAIRPAALTLASATSPCADDEVQARDDERGPLPTRPGVTSAIEAGTLLGRMQHVSLVNLVVIDTRDEEAFAAGHLLHARSVPPSEATLLAAGALPEVLAAQLALGGEIEVAIYDHGDAEAGAWSRALAHALRERGVDVLLVQDGYATFAQRFPHAVTTTLPAQRDDYFRAMLAFPSTVLDGFLFLGDRHQAADREALRALGITHVINATREVDDFFEGELQYERVALDDDDSSSLAPHLARLVELLTALSQEEGRARVLVHCRLGLSRSASIVLAYLIATRRVGVTAAVEELARRRPIIAPSRRFLEDLEDYQLSLGIEGASPRRYNLPLHVPELPADIDAAHLPRHVGFIMDGNRRWSVMRKVAGSDGHHASRETVEKLVRCMARWGIEAATLYALSSENMQRPDVEVLSLLDSLEIGLGQVGRIANDEGIRLRVCGALDDPLIPESLREVARRVTLATRHNTKCMLTIAVNYGGRQDILRAVHTLAARGLAAEVDEQTFGRALEENAPGGDIDLVIRTSGVFRLSNFMLWQSSYAELYFTDKLFPDFGPFDLMEALRVYQARQRRFGK